MEEDNPTASQKVFLEAQVNANCCRGRRSPGGSAQRPRRGVAIQTS